MPPRRTALASVLAVIMIVLVPILFMARTTEPAAADPLVSCSYHRHPSHVVCSLAGTVILDVPVPVPTVTLPPIRITVPPVTLPPVRVTVAGPTRSVTVHPAPVRITETSVVHQTIPGLPGSKFTVLVPGGTKTVKVPTAGQTPTARATVSASPQIKTNTVHETRTKTETIVRSVAVGLLVSLVLAALGILALFLGYLLGHKDAERQENDFLRGMLREIRGGKHS